MMPPAEFTARALEALDALPLEVLHGMPLECDGASQALSQVLLHAGIDYAIHIGSLSVDGSGHIPLHWWVTLPTGQCCDIRARIVAWGCTEGPPWRFSAHRHPALPVQGHVCASQDSGALQHSHFGGSGRHRCVHHLGRSCPAPCDPVR